MPHANPPPNEPRKMLGLTTAHLLVGARPAGQVVEQPEDQTMGAQPQPERLDLAPRPANQPQSDPMDVDQTADPSSLAGCSGLSNIQQVKQNYERYRAAALAAGWSLPPHTDDLADMCEFNAVAEQGDLHQMGGGADPQDQWTKPKGKGPSQHQRREFKFQA